MKTGNIYDVGAIQTAVAIKALKAKAATQQTLSSADLVPLLDGLAKVMEDLKLIARQAGSVTHETKK